MVRDGAASEAAAPPGRWRTGIVSGSRSVHGRWGLKRKFLASTLAAVVVVPVAGGALLYGLLARRLPTGERGGSQYFLWENVPFAAAKQDLLVGNAAREAELDYKTFFEKMKKHGLSKWDLTS